MNIPFRVTFLFNMEKGTWVCQVQESKTLTVVSKIQSKMVEGPLGSGCSLEKSRQMTAVGVYRVISLSVLAITDLPLL